MGLRLILLRHAKSDWGADASSDHERPLNKRGRSDAPRVGRRLVELGWAPELVISSDAVRARETWRRMADLFEGAELRLEPRFYLARPDVVRSVLGELPMSIRTVMVVGHNPGWSDLGRALTGAPTELTTANALLLRTTAKSWLDAMGRTDWQCEHLVRPKDL